MSWNPYYGYAPPQVLNGSFMGGGGYQIPPAALPYLSAEQIQMLGGSNQQNPVDAFVQSLPPEIQSNPTSILQAASSDPSLAQAVIEKYDIPDAGSMTFENPYRNSFEDFALQAAKSVLIPYGAAMGASALFGAGAGGAGAAAAAPDLGALISEGMGPQAILAGSGGLSPIALPAGLASISSPIGAAYAAPGAAVSSAGLAAGPFGGAPLAGASLGAGATGILDGAGNVIPGTEPIGGNPAPSIGSPMTGGVADAAGNIIPGTEDVATGSLFSQRLRDALGSFGQMLSSGQTPPIGGGYGGGGGGQDNAGLMQMMGALLQRQRQPVPQVQMGARYKPYG